MPQAPNPKLQILGSKSYGRWHERRDLEDHDRLVRTTTTEALRMKIKEIGFVAIPVTDIPRARKFYEDVLGLHVSDEMMGGKWIEYSLGDKLAIANVGEQWKTSDQGTGAALDVENFDEAINQLRNQAVPFAAESFETPCCHMAVVKDPDRNKLIIHKLKPEHEKGVCK